MLQFRKVSVCLDLVFNLNLILKIPSFHVGLTLFESDVFLLQFHVSLRWVTAGQRVGQLCRILVWMTFTQRDKYVICR